MPAAPSLSVLIVTLNSRAELARLLPALTPQLQPGDEIVIADNGSSDGTPELAAGLAPDALIVLSGANLGFAEGMNVAARHASNELVVLLNPDVVPAPGFAEAIRRPAAERAANAVWMGLVTSGGGATVNTSGGVVHFTGISWAGRIGEPVATVEAEPHAVGFASGACMATLRSTWEGLGGFPPEYFMYCEDMDFSLRARLLGGTVRVVPEARVDHDYAFDKGPAKWRLLERNRWATILRTYPPGLLAVVAPALVATEIALVAVSLSGRWGAQKALASADTLRALPRLLRERRAVQARRRVSAADFAAALTADLSSPYLGRAGRAGALRSALRAYWKLALALLRAAERPSDAAAGGGRTAARSR